MKTIGLNTEKDDWVRYSYKMEIEILKQVKYKTLPYFVDMFESKGRLCIIMEYINGVNLEQWIKEYGPMNQYCVVKYGITMTDTLKYLHSFQKPIIYGDMKPSNIILKPDGTIKLIDFGSAYQKNMVCEENRYYSGTKGYSPPELWKKSGELRKNRMDERGDVYSLGATLFYMATGMHPRKEIQSFELGYDIKESISKELEHIIAKATKDDAMKRYQKMDEIKLELVREQERVGKGFHKSLLDIKKKLRYLLLIIIMIGSLGAGYSEKTYVIEKSCSSFTSNEAQVSLSDTYGRKVLINKDCIFYTESTIFFNIDQENYKYFVSVNNGDWNILKGEKYQLDVSKKLKNGAITKIVFFSLSNKGSETQSKTFLVCYENKFEDH